MVETIVNIIPLTIIITIITIITIIIVLITTITTITMITIKKAELQHGEKRFAPAPPQADVLGSPDRAESLPPREPKPLVKEYLGVPQRAP